MSDAVISADESEEHDERWAQCPFCGHWMNEGGGGGNEPCPHFICDTWVTSDWEYVFSNSVTDFADDADTLCRAVRALKDEMEHDAATQDQVQRQIAQAPESVSKLLEDMMPRQSGYMQDFVSLFADHAHKWDDVWGYGCFFFAADAQTAGEKLQVAVRETLDWINEHVETE